MAETKTRSPAEAAKWMAGTALALSLRLYR